MKVTIEEFKIGGGWYLRVNDRICAALLPADIQYIVDRWGGTSKKALVKQAVEEAYAEQLLAMEARKLGVNL
jgi:hypothetical protein